MIGRTAINATRSHLLTSPRCNWLEWLRIDHSAVSNKGSASRQDVNNVPEFMSLSLFPCFLAANANGQALIAFRPGIQIPRLRIRNLTHWFRRVGQLSRLHFLAAEISDLGRRRIVRRSRIERVRWVNPFVISKSRIDD